MANAWGTSWGTAWGNSWGVSVPASTTGGGTPAIWNEDEERYPPIPQNPQHRAALDLELSQMFGGRDSLRIAVPARVTALQPDLDMAMVLMLIAIDDDA